ncbi:hypothetical protein IGI04_006667 [Brassica rapa subsp. trilocularis]|uniref:Rhodanese domain-containing protein n=1 Tax=Brassica rapa subsp. trilocularis TaxID=1813537 RepID=A0ABQ7NHJ8_BRACM|nr:hypothetical protein IGI04_006667 [Brassica rapa subsp. trilocularis]
MASTLFSRAASHRLITPSLVPQKTLSERKGSSTTGFKSIRVMASTGVVAKAGYEPVAHIPGPLFFDLDRTTSLPHMLPSEEAFAAGCSALGIENKGGVVVYGVWVLDGGLPRWRAPGDAILKASAASEAIEKIYQGHSVSPVTFKTKFQPHLVWTLEQSLVREYEAVISLEANVSLFLRCLILLLLTHSYQQKTLKKRFEQEGKTILYQIEEPPLDKPVMASCGTGVTACILALGLHRLGETEVPVYDGMGNRTRLTHGR